MIPKILENLNIPSLNEMQVKVLDASEKSSDIILYSPTGSGKTLGFLLPILKTLDPEKKGVQALVLAPSRELALQIEKVFRTMGTGFKVNCCYGGHSTRIEKNNLEHPPAVLIGTPGRIAYHIRNESFDPSTVTALVLDEFDKALEFGFKEDMSFIISSMNKLKKRFLTSATEMDEIPSFTGLKSPTVVNFLSTEAPKGLTVKIVRSHANDKLEALFALVCKVGAEPTLIFCNHREAVERISELLSHKGLGHEIFHGAMEQDERERALIKFRNGTNRILITTDLASRGLDIPEIMNVVHYQIPVNENVFIHRNGRTARVNAKGNAFIILAEDEYLPSFITDSPETEVLPKKNVLPPPSEWSTLYIGAGKKDKVNKTDIVGFLIQTGSLEKDEVGKIEVLDFASFVAIKKNKVNQVIQKIKDQKIKKKSVKIQISK